MHTHIPVLILAGGQGSRIRHLLGDLPKPMYPVHGLPFLDYQLNLLKGEGFSHFYISCGYQAQVIAQYYSTNANITIIRETQPLGTGGALLLALESISAEQLLCLKWRFAMPY